MLEIADDVPLYLHYWYTPYQLSALIMLTRRKGQLYMYLFVEKKIRLVYNQSTADVLSLFLLSYFFEDHREEKRQHP